MLRPTLTARTMVLKDSPRPVATHVFLRGNYMTPGRRVEVGVPGQPAFVGDDLDRTVFDQRREPRQRSAVLAPASAVPLHQDHVAFAEHPNGPDAPLHLAQVAQSGRKQDRSPFPPARLSRKQYPLPGRMR